MNNTCKGGEVRVNIKELKERKVELLEEMENMTKDISLFNSAKFDEIKAELEDVENKIFEYKNNSTVIKNVEKEVVKKMKLKDLLLNNKAVNLSKINNEGEMVREGNEAIQKETFEATIEKKVEEECLLYGMVRKVMTASPHNIPIQAEKLDKFLNVKELGEYQKDMPTYRKVVLGAEKYGLLVVLSEELLADQQYNLEADIQEQIVGAFAKTMEEIIIKGDEDNGVEGLLMAEDALKVKSSAVTYDALVEMIFAMPKALRKDAAIVCNERFIKDVMLLQDENKRPLLDMNMGQLNAKFDAQILGFPVIITPELAEGEVPAIFVNLDKALVVGVRQGMELRKSDQVMFLQDAVALKANCRIDAKILDPQAIVKFVQAE